jgi:hypothetical protein
MQLHSAGVVIVMGMHRLDTEFSGSTLFNTVVVIGDDGTIPEPAPQASVPTNQAT